jgi:uncharacterized protein
LLARNAFTYTLPFPFFQAVRPSGTHYYPGQLGPEWSRVDEWYSFETSPRAKGVKVLATLDERTYRPKMLWMNIAMGADHPIIWKHCVGKGRAFYSALGHSATTYQEPLHLKELEGGMAWAAGLEGAMCSQ